MAKWEVFKTQRFIVDGAPDAIAAIQATKDAKSFNYVDVRAVITDGYTGLSARPHVVNDMVEIKDPAQAEDENRKKMVVAFASAIARTEVRAMSDGRLKNQWFNLLREIGGVKSTSVAESWQTYKNILAEELTARELMDADGHIVSVSGTRTPRKH